MANLKWCAWSMKNQNTISISKFSILNCATRCEPIAFKASEMIAKKKKMSRSLNSISICYNLSTKWILHDSKNFFSFTNLRTNHCNKLFYFFTNFVPQFSQKAAFGSIFSLQFEQKDPPPISVEPPPHLLQIIWPWAKMMGPVTVIGPAHLVHFKQALWIDLPSFLRNGPVSFSVFRHA